MRTFFNDVCEFHKKFGLNTPGTTKPRLLDKETQRFRFDFLKEELTEFATAYMDGQLEEAVDALVDLVYVALGTAAMMGVPFNECWAEVHRANMAKERALGANDPRSTRSNSLDVVKPVGWQPPNHEPIIAAARKRHEW